MIFASWMRCTQYVHFSITPRKRTVTFGFCCIFSVSGSPPVSFHTDVVVPVEVVEARTLYGQLFAQYRVPMQRL